MSTWHLRERLEAESGIWVKPTQLDSYRKWGLISRRSDKRWDPQVVGQVTTIHRVAAEEPRLLSLPRRVVYLRGDYLSFPVPDGTVREAIVAMLPIRAGYRKIRRVNTVFNRWADYRRGAVVPVKRPGWKPPRPPQWTTLLTDPRRIPVIEMHFVGIFFWLRVMQDLGESIGYDLDDIPFEERVLLLTLINAAHL